MLEELVSIGTLHDDSVIVIDDARLFLCAPPGKHNVQQWPDLESVLNALRSLSLNHHLVIVNDTFLFYPKQLKEAVEIFCQEYGQDTLSAWDKFREYDVLFKQLLEKEACIQEQARLLQEKESCIQEKNRRLVSRFFWLWSRR